MAKLGDWMAERDLSPEEAAKLFEVDAVSVRRYLSGSRIPSWRVMPRIIRATEGEVTANDFLRDERRRKSHADSVRAA